MKPIIITIFNKAAFSSPDDTGARHEKTGGTTTVIRDADTWRFDKESMDLDI